MLPHPLSESENARVWRCGDYALPLGAKTYVMAILNATPDSFSGDGLTRGGEIHLKNVVENARRLIEAGADILDIGGESTRPGAKKVSPEEEARRVLPLIEALAPLGVPLSVDTTKSEIARRAVQSGAAIINDISGGLADENMLRVLAPEKCGLILMHRRGTSQNMKWSEKPGDDATEKQTRGAPEIGVENTSRKKTMHDAATCAAIGVNRATEMPRNAATQNDARVLAARAAKKSSDGEYRSTNKMPDAAARNDARTAPDKNAARVLAPHADIIAEVLSFWRERLNATRNVGINDARLCFDAGFGFGKSVEENLELVRRGGELSAFGFPTLSATSRKSTIARVLAHGDEKAIAPESDARLFGTAALTALAIAGGCDIVRVHDVEAMAQVAKLCDATLRR